MSKISIIAPIYNQENNLLLCIESVLAQTFIDFELILINRGSTDDSEKICNEYAQKDFRISVIHRKNSDLASAYNIGINQATGEFIAYIDCDDFLHEQMMEVLYHQIVSTKADIALCDFEPIEEKEEKNENRRKNPLINYSVTTSSGTQALNGLYDTDRLFAVPWSKIYRKNLFKNIKYPEGYVDEDEFVAHKLLYEATKVVYVHTPLYYYVICEGRKGSLTPIPMTEEKFDKMLALYERAVFFRDKKLRNIEEKALLHFAEHFFWYYLQSQIELPKAEGRRKEIKKLFKQLFFRMINNSQENKKKKIVFSAFRLSPSIHKFLISRLEGNRLVKQV